MLKNIFPFLEWSKNYTKSSFLQDLIAAIIVTIMLVPQSLAYAMLAGLPSYVGLYASILPLILYALFGTGRTLAVGPVAVISLMTATGASAVAAQGTADYLAATVILAFLSGLILLVMGLFRLGFIANLLSHPVIVGFITASGIMIAAGQLRHILGIKGGGDNLIAIVTSLYMNSAEINKYALLIGISALISLFYIRQKLKTHCVMFGVKAETAAIFARIAPIFVIITSILFVYAFKLNEEGVKIIGTIPKTLPSLSLPFFDKALWVKLLPASLFIALVGFVESVSVGKTLAAKRKQQITPNNELIALGAANMSSSFSGGFPVTGGFARSIVNFDAGAQTPLAGAFTAIFIVLVILFLSPYLYYLPQATLAATIILAVLSIIDTKAIHHIYDYSKVDFMIFLATCSITLINGVEPGIISGVIISLLLFLYKTTYPHVAIIGQVGKTEHFRNILRHEVITHPHILSIRIDESLYFANAQNLEDLIYKLALSRPECREVIVQCTAINEVDITAMEMLISLNEKLKNLTINLNFSEIKGPVMDKLIKTDLIKNLSGKVYISHYDAVQHLKM